MVIKPVSHSLDLVLSYCGLLADDCLLGGHLHSWLHLNLTSGQLTVEACSQSGLLCPCVLVPWYCCSITAYSFFSTLNLSGNYFAEPITAWTVASCHCFFGCWMAAPRLSSLCKEASGFWLLYCNMPLVCLHAFLTASVYCFLPHIGLQQGVPYGK